MYEAKTKSATGSVDSYLATIRDETRRDDCRVLTDMMQRLSGHTPTMWGSSIVGLGQYHYAYAYAYASGHEGDSCLVGYSSRKGDISVYLLTGYETDETRALLAHLGRHKIGKACLYLRRLSDVQLSILEQLIARSIAATKARYPA